MDGDIAKCYGKKVFRTYYQAARSAKQLNKWREGAKAHIYKCSVCGNWHVGNSTGKMKRKNYE